MVLKTFFRKKNSGHVAATGDGCQRSWGVWGQKEKERIKRGDRGVPVVAQWLTNPTRNHEVAVRSLPLLIGLTIRRCRELWCRLQTRLGSRVAVALLWLWRRPVATAPIQPLAWEPPYAAGAAQEMPKKTNK